MQSNACRRTFQDRIFTAHVAAVTAVVLILSGLGAFLASAGTAKTQPTVHLNVAAPVVPTVVATPAPKPRPAAPKPVAAVAAPHAVVHVQPAAVRTVPVHYSPPVATGSETKTALIIGVGDPVGAQALPGADADARNEQAALLKDGFPAGNIQMLIDSQATRSNILAGLHSLISRTARNGTAVFAVSTHSSNTSFRTYEGNRIQRDEVASLLGQVPGRLLAIFAVCFADSYNIPGVTGPNHVAVFSSAGGEETWENSAGSDFIRAFVLEAMLDHKAANSSVEAAFTYADHEMLANGSGHPSINDQVPGNFIL